MLRGTTESDVEVRIFLIWGTSSWLLLLEEVPLAVVVEGSGESGRLRLSIDDEESFKVLSTLGMEIRCALDRAGNLRAATVGLISFSNKFGGMWFGTS